MQQAAQQQAMQQRRASEAHRHTQSPQQPVPFSLQQQGPQHAVPQTPHLQSVPSQQSVLSRDPRPSPAASTVSIQGNTMQHPQAGNVMNTPQAMPSSLPPQQMVARQMQSPSYSPQQLRQNSAAEPMGHPNAEHMMNSPMVGPQGIPVNAQGQPMLNPQRLPPGMDLQALLMSSMAQLGYKGRDYNSLSPDEKVQEDLFICI